MDDSVGIPTSVVIMTIMWDETCLRVMKAVEEGSVPEGTPEAFVN